MVASPVFLLGSVLATILASLFDLVVGKHWSDLVLYWFIGIMGFFVGQAMSMALGFDFMRMGDIHLLGSVVCCGLFMALARWLKV
jgi:hypothetical protein